MENVIKKEPLAIQMYPIPGSQNESGENLSSDALQEKGRRRYKSHWT
jgi:hypothetical protein